ncbi:MAG: rhomboid family intramembrane serine protease [Lachnospiraceae bacterium]|nr:rhomboid family intramembrane serine protease [Lachnospiraceae bacterium]
MERKGNGAYVTWGIMIMNIVYFLYLDLTGSSEDVGYMLEHGAMYVPYVLDGEYHRVLTSMFMHFGISHLVNNMLILFILGAYLERAFGRIRYLLFYLSCGVGANLVSIGYDLFLEAEKGIPLNVVSAGASGAIFGLAGGLLLVVLINKGRLEDLDTKRVIGMIALSLYLGFQNVETDDLAHVAGVVIGFFLAALIYRRPKGDDLAGAGKGGERYEG